MPIKPLQGLDCSAGWMGNCPTPFKNCYSSGFNFLFKLGHQDVLRCGEIVEPLWSSGFNSSGLVYRLKQESNEWCRQTAVRGYIIILVIMQLSQNRFR